MIKKNLLVCEKSKNNISLINMMEVIIGLLLSVIYSYLVLPKKEKEAPKISPTLYPIIFKGMMMIPISKEKCFHIHHWIINLFILIISLFIYIPKIIIGFSLGLFLQGLSYKDRFHFIINNPY